MTSAGQVEGYEELRDPLTKIGELGLSRPLRWRRTEVLPHRPNPTDPTKLPCLI